MQKIISIASTPQNLVKLATIDKALKKYRKDVKNIICFFGPEKDERTSLGTFVDLDLPRTHWYVSYGEGSDVEQAATAMLEFEKILKEEKPSLVFLSGHENATLACGITASKMNITLAHIDAGLRNFDRASHEEMNRVLIDTLCDYHFVSEHSGMKNLRDEGEENNNIFFTGNSLVDSLESYWNEIQESGIVKKLNLESKDYIVSSYYHPENLSSLTRMTEIVDKLNKLSEKCTIVWPLSQMEKNSLIGFMLDTKINPNIMLTEMIPYIEFLGLLYKSKAVMTDTSEIQEETTYLGVQCITIRKFTERIVTLDVGTNHLVGMDADRAEKVAEDILDGTTKPGRVPEMWDGKSGKRIAEITVEQILGISQEPTE
jgi:UDP-N-acetylglucosamine 2-epimerase (non-hydrolysing)